jgi:Flp pilus assembly pilin Flp
MYMRFGSRRGQTMVEYIIIVVLIAVTLIVLFSKLSKATGRKVAGATAALDATEAGNASAALNNIDENRLRNLDESGNLN